MIEAINYNVSGAPTSWSRGNDLSRVDTYNLDARLTGIATTYRSALSQNLIWP